ncbi:hypothetical protein SNEBB_006315 [Seison nebaliae]|nr:hypothetical protein SNEBB_006315 [Seison nebaliae]
MEEGNDERLQLEEMRKRWKDIQTVRTDLVEWQRKLREKNVLASSGERITTDHLNANVRRCSSISVKLKTLSESSCKGVLDDLHNFKFQKFLSEGAKAVVDCKIKSDAIRLMVEVVSYLHQLYEEFQVLLIDQYQKSMKDLKKKNNSKLLIDLRLIAELSIVGAIDEPSGKKLIYHVFKQLLSNKESNGNNSNLNGNNNMSSTNGTSVIVTNGNGDQTSNETYNEKQLQLVLVFLKSYSLEFCGIHSKENKKFLSDFHGEYSSIYGTSNQESWQLKFFNVFSTYLKNLFKILDVSNDRILSMEKNNHHILQTTGILHDERTTRLNELKSSLDELKKRCEQLCNLLDVEMPELKKNNLMEDQPQLSVNVLVTAGVEVPQCFEGLSPLWEDNDMKNFYENYNEVSEKLRGMEQHLQSEEKKRELYEKKLLQQRQNIQNSTIQSNGKKISINSKYINILDDEYFDEDMPSITPSITPAELEDQLDDETKVTRRFPCAKKMEQFAKSLLEMTSIEKVKELTEEFILHYNNSHGKSYLIYLLQTSPNQRLELLPYYARFIVIVNPYMHELRYKIKNYLFRYLHYHIIKKSQLYIGSKIKAVKYLGELCKFRLISVDESMNIFNRMIRDFHHHNIEMASLFLESCGRFLYRSQTSHHRMTILLTALMRKKDQLINDRHRVMIENAYLCCLPIEPLQILQVQLSPELLYMERLLYHVLTDEMVEQVLNSLLKFDIDENEEHRQHLIKCFTYPNRCRINSVSSMAQLLCGVQCYYPKLTNEVLDRVIDEVITSLLTTEPSFNQRRISLVNYLASLYLFKLINSDIIFNLLYLIIMYGVSYDANNPSVYDPPMNHNRLRIACTLLSVCGKYFQNGEVNEKLKYYLKYFSMYYQWKRLLHWQYCTEALEKSNRIDNKIPWKFPIEIDLIVQGMFNVVSPNQELPNNFMEACKAVTEIEEEFLDRHGDELKRYRIANQTESRDQTMINQSDISSSPSTNNNNRLNETFSSKLRRTISTDSGRSNETLCESSDREGDESNFGEENDDELDFMIEEYKKQGEQELESKWKNYSNKHPKNLIFHIKKTLIGDHQDNNESLGSNGEQQVKFTLVHRANNRVMEKVLNIPLDIQFAERYRRTQRQMNIDANNVKNKTMAIIKNNDKNNQIDRLTDNYCNGDKRVRPSRKKEK